MESAEAQGMEFAWREEPGRPGYSRQVDEMKDALTLAVSHELRTLITICRGHLDVLAPGASEREVQDVKETLVSVLSLMTRLADDLTILEKLRGGVQLEMESLSVDDFVGIVARQVAPILGHRLTVESRVGGARLHADPQRLTQALLNLLRNAAEHARGDCPVRLRVELESSSCRFEVADEGGGLAPGEEHVVFESFRTGSSPAAGTGLGLPIVQAVAQAHGGDCGVVNRPGQGATFWMTIPWSTS